MVPLVAADLVLAMTRSIPGVAFGVFNLLCGVAAVLAVVGLLAVRDRLPSNGAA